MAYFFHLVVEQTVLAVKHWCLLMDCSFAYDHFQKTQQLARGEGKIVLSIDIRCIGTSGKTAQSAHPKFDLLSHRNVWKRGIGWG